MPVVSVMTSSLPPTPAAPPPAAPCNSSPNIVNHRPGWWSSFSVPPFPWGVLWTKNRGGSKKEANITRFGRLFNSKRMVITLVDEILTPRGGRTEQMWTGFTFGLTLLEDSKTKGNKSFWQPISQFCHLQEISWKGNKKAKKTYTPCMKHFCLRKKEPPNCSMILLLM